MGPASALRLMRRRLRNTVCHRKQLDEHARQGQLYIHPKPRLISTIVYPDDTCIHMESLSAPGTYVEGVRTEILEDDGSQEWQNSVRARPKGKAGGQSVGGAVTIVSR